MSELHAHHAYRYYRPGPTEVQISRALEKAIRRSEVVDRESLCILAGQKVHSDLYNLVLAFDADCSTNQFWQIRLDVHFLNDEGNLLDCASVACVAALRHFRKPEVSIEGTDVTIVRSLSLKHSFTLQY